MNLDKLFAGGEELHVGKRIGKGGEGEVYALSNLPGFAVKAYLPAVVAARETKIKAMVAANLHSSMSTVAFPTKVVLDRKGSFVGFLMHLVADHKEIHELQTPSSRLKHFPSADYRFLVRTAINVARVFGQVHAAGCVVGDINQRSILVSQQATVALIDTDSFQVSYQGQQFLCVVGVPEYTPPELQGQSLKGIVRTSDHDAFGLAVAIFQILCMDRHPYSGRFKGTGDMPIEQAIKEFRFAYSSRDTRMDPPPSTVRMNDLSPKVRENFELAFSPQGVGRRPTSTQWILALEELETSLRPCTLNRAHHYSRTASECPWCRMEQAFGVPMFVSKDASSIHIPRGMVDDKVGFSFNVTAVLHILNSLRPPPQISIPIPTATGRYSASAEAIAFLSGNTSNKTQRYLGVAGAIASAWLFLANPGTVAIAFVIGVISLSFAFRPDNSTQIFTKKYNDAAEKLREKIIALQSNAPIQKLLATRLQIEQKISEYNALVNDFANVEKDYGGVRRQQQLDAHLSSSLIRGARIAKLTSSDVSALASFGFTNAFDAKMRNVQIVHGIGPVKADNINSWVAAVERKFSFFQNYTPADHDAIRKSRDTIVSRQQGCADAINKLLDALKIESKAVNDWTTVKDREVHQLAEELAKAEADLIHLKLNAPGVRPVPPFIVNTAKSNPTSYSLASPGATYIPPTQNSGSTPSCPTCGSRMRYRTARRGTRAGRPFWGCSRYPTCRGTRNI